MTHVKTDRLRTIVDMKVTLVDGQQCSCNLLITVNNLIVRRCTMADVPYGRHKPHIAGEERIDGCILQALYHLRPGVVLDNETDLLLGLRGS